MGFISGIATTILYVITFMSMLPASIQILVDQNISNPMVWAQYIISSFFPSSFPEITLKINEMASNNSIYPIDIGPVSILLLFPYIMWLLSYQIGLFLNLKHTKKYPLSKKIILHIQALFLSLVLGILETFPAFCSIIEYSLRNRRNAIKKIHNYDFYVISK